jgi:hypothetical protein
MRGDPVADSLREELLAIAGIDGADFDGGVVAPDGVRVRLAAGADPIRVGEEVRKVLADHGLRSQMTSPEIAPEIPPGPPTQLEPAVAPPPPPDSTAPVVTMPHVAARSVAPDDVVMVAPAEQAAVESPIAPADGGVADVETMELAATPEVEIIEPETASDPTAQSSGDVRLRSVAVEEAIDGLTVVVTRSDGVTAQRPARNPGKGLDAAVVAGVSELAGDETGRPRLIGVFDAEAEGVGVVTVVVEVDDGSLRAGSAVVEGGRAFGVARATWKALSAPV